jgi:hypothetical protein
MSIDPSEALRTFLKDLPPPLKPFSPEALAFCGALSQELFALENISSFPDAAALAYWLRPAHLQTLQEAFEKGKAKETLAVPRGLAFHIAPANVETIFVYSWVLSLLAGNLNAIRLPTKDSPSKELLFATVRALLARPPFKTIAQGTLLLNYGHDPEITELLSREADVRVIWGGDATVRTLRAFPLKVDGKEVVFVDRYAYGALKASAWLALSQEERLKVVQAVYQDTFYFEQQACSSTRALFWVGSEEETHAALHTFYPLLQEVIERKQLHFPTSFVLKKLTHVYGLALNHPLQGVHRYSNELTLIELQTPSLLLRDSCGGGLLFHVGIKSLKELEPFVSRKDQTLTHFGFQVEEIKHFAEQLNGKGFDRIVPVGKALEFNALWDGYDLLREFTRLVTTF